MDNDPEIWRWIWLVAALVFGVGEILIAGSFFLAPFAIAAAVTAVFAFAGVSLPVQWVVFVGLSAALLAALRPLARKLDAGDPVLGVGSHRQLGQQARVLEPIDNREDRGFVLLGAEKWRAEAADGSAIPAGANVTVVEVRGTRLLVTATDDATITDPTPD